MVTIRGAITINENKERDILDGTIELLKRIEEENSIDKSLVISIIFSITEDLNEVYPARAAREIGYTMAGLMCFNEMKTKNGLKKCIRLIMFYNCDKVQDQVKHVYLKGAKSLRTDLIK